MSTQRQHRFNRACGCALVVLALGCLAWLFRVGAGLSYDLAFAFAWPVAPTNVLIIAMDEQSHRELGQEWGQPWDRALHARLLRHLKQCQSGPVIFDVVFSQPRDAATDADFARAIAEHGQVVLAADLVPMNQPGLPGLQSQPPAAPFLHAARGWGLAEVMHEADGAVRRHYNGTETDPSLAWIAASVLKSPETSDPKQRLNERWIRYYGPPYTIPMLSYYSAFDRASNFFTGKLIIVGGKPKTRYSGEENEQFRSPHLLWTGEFMSGVELHTTMLLNLLRRDWLSRLRPAREAAVIIAVSLLVGFGLALLKPVPGALVGVGLALLAAALGILFALKIGAWFPWVTVSGIIVPAAWLSALATYKSQVRRRASYSEYAEAPQLPSAEPQPAEVSIPEHALIKSIGRGAYGDVWLGRNRVGLYHAVKIVFRKRFPESVPYEREFRGIRKYMPVSLRHPGLVRILQVGRNDPLGYFYYVMELGDDEVTGSDINPANYTARNLAKDLTKRGRLSIAETLALGLALSEPLEYLHKKGLLHRDIKPSNIIFVDGIPKLADIGLVTSIEEPQGEERSYVGTEGYVDPNGPSKPSSDIYSFGKVLYEAATGLDRRQFPTLPEWVNDESDGVAEFMALNSVILKCCDTNPRKRYQSVSELHQALLEVERNVARAPA